MQIRSIFSYQYPIRQGSCTAGVALFTLWAAGLAPTYPLRWAGSARPLALPMGELARRSRD